MCLRKLFLRLFLSLFHQTKAEEVCVKLTSDYDERLAVVSHTNLHNHVCVVLLLPLIYMQGKFMTIEVKVTLSSDAIIVLVIPNSQCLCIDTIPYLSSMAQA